MKLHRNAKTTPTSRLALVRRAMYDGWRYQAVAEGYGVSVRTVAKWVQRFRQDGAAGLEDGSSRPQQTPHITPPIRVTFIRQLREQHGLPAWAIARALQMPRSTVGAWLRRLGLSQRAQRSAGAHPALRVATAGGFVARRHQAPGPISARRPPDSRQPAPRLAGGRVGIRARRGGRSHAARLRRSAGQSDRPDLRGVSRARRHLVRGAPHHHPPRDERQRERLRVPRLSRRLRRSNASPSAHTALHARTNGKAERFIQTLLREWAYVQPYATSGQRRRACGRGCVTTITTGPTPVSTINPRHHGYRVLPDEQRV